MTIPQLQTLRELLDQFKRELPIKDTQPLLRTIRRIDRNIVAQTRRVYVSENEWKLTIERLIK